MKNVTLFNLINATDKPVQVGFVSNQDYDDYKITEAATVCLPGEVSSYKGYESRRAGRDVSVRVASLYDEQGVFEYKPINFYGFNFYISVGASGSGMNVCVYGKEDVYWRPKYKREFEGDTGSDDTWVDVEHGKLRMNWKFSKNSIATDEWVYNFDLHYEYVPS